MWDTILQQSVGLILLSAFAGKTAGPGDFFETIARQGLVTKGLARPLGIVVMVAEAVLGFGLVIIIEPRDAFGVFAGLLFLGFAAWTLLVLRRKETTGPRLDCGCMGSILKLRVEWTTAGINALLAIVVLGTAIAGLDGTVAGFGERLVALLLSILLTTTYWLSLYASSIVVSLHSIRGVST